MKKVLFAALLSLNLLTQAEEVRFPEPMSDEVAAATKALYELGKNEIFSQPYRVFTQFLWDRYVSGPSNVFEFYGCNPTKLSPEQSRRPATILVHGSSSNQGHWLPLLHSIHDFEAETDQSGPVFTFNFDEATAESNLVAKIEAIRDLYLDAGVSDIDINLVGHSLGAIVSVEYAFHPESWLENTTVKKVISIAGRLKNIEPPTNTPYYAYCFDVLERVDHTWDAIQQNRGVAELYTIAAGDDWLVPLESVLVGDDASHQAVIPGKGHVLVPCSHLARDLVISWLFAN